jgi:hypothetical protein
MSAVSASSDITVEVDHLLTEDLNEWLDEVSGRGLEIHG